MCKAARLCDHGYSANMDAGHRFAQGQPYGRQNRYDGSYSGEMDSDGWRHGYGVFASFRDDGSNFAGLWLGGKMNGLFVCEEFNERTLKTVVYRGEMCNNQRHGLGTWSYGELVASHELPPQLLADIITVSAAAAHSADHNNTKLKQIADSRAMESTQMRRGFLSLATTVSEHHSKHPYDNNADIWGIVQFDPAAKSTCERIDIVFDPKTRTESNRDFIQFFDAKTGSAISPKFSGRGPKANFPGLHGNPALQICAASVRYHFTSDSQNNDFGYVFYASATWSPHALDFPHPIGIGGKIWDETAKVALMTRREKWVDGPREEQARVKTMACELVLSVANAAVAQVELRNDAIMCSTWAVTFLIRSAILASEAAAARAAAALHLMQTRNLCASVLCAAFRRTRDSYIHRNKIVTAPSVPRGCRRLAIAVQESKISYVFLRHVIDAGVDDNFLSNISMKDLLDKNISVNDAIKLLNAVETYTKAHSAADAAADHLERSIHLLEAASQTLRRLTINDVLEIRGMSTPSLGVRLLMQCVCLVLRVKPLVKLDALRQPIYDYWEPSKQQLLVDPKAFLERLWAAMGHPLEDSIVKQVEQCLEHPDMALDRLKRITKSSVSDVAQWLRALCQHFRANAAVSRESLILATSESASKRLFMAGDSGAPPETREEEVAFKMTVKGNFAIFPAVGCGVLMVLAYGPKINASIKDIQAATGLPLAKVEGIVTTMMQEKVLQQEKAVNGVSTFSVTVGASFDASTAARHCRALGLFKTDFSYAMQVKSLASLPASIFEQKPSARSDPNPGPSRRR